MRIDTQDVFPLHDFTYALVKLGVIRKFDSTKVVLNSSPKPGCLRSWPTSSDRIGFCFAWLMLKLDIDPNPINVGSLGDLIDRLVYGYP